MSNLLKDDIGGYIQYRSYNDKVNLNMFKEIDRNNGY